MAIAEHGSYTKAAHALRVSQPSLSQQIKHLEETVRSTLLVRSGRAIRLTDAGEIYLHHARRAFGEIDSATRAIQEVQNLSRGSLRLGWTPITDYLACSLLEQFSRKYPGITLCTLEMPADDIASAIIEDQIDVGITFGNPPFRTQDTQGLDTTPLFRETLCFAMGNKHSRAGQKEQLNVQEFNNESLILLNPRFALRRRIDAYCLNHGIMPHIAIETDSLSVIIEIIQNSTYGTILPKSIIQSQCGISPILLIPTLASQPINLIKRDSGYNSPATVAFAGLATDWSMNPASRLPNSQLKPCTSATNDQSLS